jgi:hypothetical protein
MDPHMAPLHTGTGEETCSVTDPLNRIPLARVHTPTLGSHSDLGGKPNETRVWP